MSACKSKFEPALQEVADKITRDLPEELARDIEFSLHEGGDRLVLKFPPSLHGTEEMQMLDRAAKRYGAAFMSREGAGAGYYLVPKAKPKLPTQLANEASAKRDAASQAPPKPEIQKGIVSGCNVAAARAEIPNATPQSPAPQPQHPDAQPHSATTSNSLPQGQSNGQMPSPIARFNTENCMFCEDAPQCDIASDMGRYRRAFCMNILDLEAKQQLIHEVFVTRGILDNYSKELVDIAQQLEKIANRPAWKGSGKQQPQKEIRVEGGIRWFWTNDKQEWEKASNANNQASKEYGELKAKVEAAVKADKKGTEIDGYWVMPDGFQKDGLIRKKLPDNKGGKT